MRPLKHRFITVLITVCALAGLGVCRAQTEQAPSPPKFRLPADVAGPIDYRAELAIVPDQDTFAGTVEIDLHFAKSTAVLWLNAEKLTLKDATLKFGNETLPARVISEPKDYAGFAFDHPVGPGPATLRVAYQGQVSRKDQAGIFQMKEGDRWYVYSQFESIDARRAFPCFDEPGYKVPWQLTLHVKKDQVALSNTPILSETDAADGTKTVKFAQTRPLPSYLVALAVGDMELVDAGTAGKKHTHIRIAVPRGRSAEAQYAAATTPTIVNLLEDYFGVPYPYDKLDEVAVPLFGGAMENAGMVTYGASIILAKPEEDTPGRQRGWVSVASHELSHQWFGDLVTTAWWNDIWLNEGFATWMANKIVNKYHPEWHLDISELNSYQGAMENDGLVSARRVRQPIESNDDIVNAFDSITYEKGSALLNMFETYMGPDRFRDGVRRYLSAHAWQNATSADFLASLAGTDTRIAPAFSSFLDQPGVPMVTVALDCQKGEATLDLAQQRFFPLGSQGGAAELWQAPVCVRYPAGSGEARECLLLDKPSSRMALPKATGCPAWVQANAGANGYYRVLYQGDLLGDLLKGEGSALTLPEKVALIGDISALTGNGKIPLGQALALAPGLARDPARQVVTKTMWVTTGLQDNLVPPNLLPQYHRYLEDLYGSRARALGWKDRPGESDDDRLLRPTLLSVIANQAEDPEFIAQAKSLTLAWLDDRKAVDRDLLSTVIMTAARHGDAALFDRLRATAKQEKDEQILSTLLYALGSFPDPAIIQKALPIVLTDEFDSRRSISIPFGVAGSPKTRDLAFDFVKQNWDALIAKLPTDSGSFLPYVAAEYCDAGHYQEVQAFFQGRSTKSTGGPRTLQQVLERINLCIAYKQAQEASVAEFLEKYIGAPGAASGGQGAK